MTNAAKNKGKGFERETCHIFESATGLSWQRVPNSGAFIGGLNAARIAALSDTQVLLCRGDIIPPTEFKGVVIECKFHKSFAFHHLFSSSRELNSWIDQCLISYNESKGKFFAVIFKINHCGAFIVVRKDQLNSSDEIGHDYMYNGIWYRITEFDENWVKKHQEEIRKLCATSN